MERTESQEWIRSRADAVSKVYTAYDAMVELGHGDGLVDHDTAIQVSCPFHGVDARPSARYYPASGHRPDYVRCYFCKENWDSLNLFMKFKGLDFMTALRTLERRFEIKVPKRRDDASIAEPIDRSSISFKSEAWQDVPRVIKLLEAKLLRLRDKTSLQDYVKFCRVLDRVLWDYNISKGESNDAMIAVLPKLRDAMTAVPDLDNEFSNSTN